MQGHFVPSLIEIGSVFWKRFKKCEKVYKQINGCQTKGEQKSSLKFSAHVTKTCHQGFKNSQLSSLESPFCKDALCKVWLNWLSGFGEEIKNWKVFWQTYGCQTKSYKNSSLAL